MHEKVFSLLREHANYTKPWDGVEWLSILQVEVQQPVPMCIECRNAVNETVQLMGRMLAALYKKITVITANRPLGAVYQWGTGPSHPMGSPVVLWPIW